MEGKVTFLLKQLQPIQISVEIFRRNKKSNKKFEIFIFAEEIIVYMPLFSTTMHFQEAIKFKTRKSSKISVLMTQHFDPKNIYAQSKSQPGPRQCSLLTNQGSHTFSTILF